MAERTGPAPEEVPSDLDESVPDDDGPGADRGVAYDRAVAADEDLNAEADRGPDIGDVYRSGS